MRSCSAKADQVCLRDLGSLNGTIVNKVPRSEIAIVGGERIQLGTTVLQIERAWMTYPMTHSIFGGDVSYHGTKRKK